MKIKWLLLIIILSITSLMSPSPGYTLDNSSEQRVHQLQLNRYLDTLPTRLKPLFQDYLKSLKRETLKSRLKLIQFLRILVNQNFSLNEIQGFISICKEGALTPKQMQREINHLLLLTQFPIPQLENPVIALKIINHSLSSDTLMKFYSLLDSHIISDNLSFSMLNFFLENLTRSPEHQEQAGVIKLLETSASATTWAFNRNAIRSLFDRLNRVRRPFPTLIAIFKNLQKLENKVRRQIYISAVIEIIKAEKRYSPLSSKFNALQKRIRRSPIF